MVLYTNNNNIDMHNIVLSGYCDSDWGGDKNDHKSTTGYTVFVNDNIVSWNTKKQATVALSTAEAELMSLVELAKEIMWYQQLFSELHIHIHTPTSIYIDNQAAIAMVMNDVAHDRSKHINVRHNFIKDAVNRGEIELKWISTENQIADIFTKNLGTNLFTRFRDRMMKSF